MVRCLKELRPVILAGTIMLIAGCATGPAPSRQAAAAPSPATAAAAMPRSGDETPMSDIRLVQSAEFTASAVRLGFEPEVHDGSVVYCWADDDLGSRIVTKKCVSQAQFQAMLQQVQQQRDTMQQKIQGGCPLFVRHCN